PSLVFDSDSSRLISGAAVAMFTRSTYVIRYITHSSPRTTDVGGGRLNLIIGAAQPVVQLHLHSSGAASLLHPNTAAALGTPALAALLLPHILPVCSVVAPCPAGRIAALGATMDLHHGLLDYLMNIDKWPIPVSLSP